MKKLTEHLKARLQLHKNKEGKLLNREKINLVCEASEKLDHNLQKITIDSIRNAKPDLIVSSQSLCDTVRALKKELKANEQEQIKKEKEKKLKILSPALLKKLSNFESSFQNEMTALKEEIAEAIHEVNQENFMALQAGKVKLIAEKDEEIKHLKDLTLKLEAKILEQKDELSVAHKLRSQTDEKNLQLQDTIKAFTKLGISSGRVIDNHGAANTSDQQNKNPQNSNK